MRPAAWRQCDIAPEIFVAVWRLDENLASFMQCSHACRNGPGAQSETTPVRSNEAGIAGRSELQNALASKHLPVGWLGTSSKQEGNV
jgi:hypothetical protein